MISWVNKTLHFFLIVFTASTADSLYIVAFIVVYIKRHSKSGLKVKPTVEISWLRCHADYMLPGNKKHV